MTRWERVAPLSGVVFAGLLVIAAVSLNNYGYLPSSESLREFFADGAGRIETAGYLGTVSGVFLIWFAGSVFASLRSAEGGNRRLSAVALGGGAVGGGLVSVAFTIIAVSGARGGASGGISSEMATLGYDLYGGIMGGALGMALAAFIGAAAVIAFRTRVWPRWLAWVSAIAALGSISPVAYIFVAVDLVWIVIVSVLLFVRERSDREPA